MLFTRPILPNLIGWQWFNQTYNAVFNYSNSAKPKFEIEKMSIEDSLVQGYM